MNSRDQHRAHIQAEERARAARWANKGLARVTHPAHGSIVVPCGSKLSAMECAAEYWGCKWLDISGATVMMPENGATPVPPPPDLIHYK